MPLSASRTTVCSPAWAAKIAALAPAGPPPTITRSYIALRSLHPTPCMDYARIPPLGEPSFAARVRLRALLINHASERLHPVSSDPRESGILRALGGIRTCHLLEGT